MFTDNVFSYSKTLAKFLANSEHTRKDVDGISLLCGHSSTCRVHQF